MSLWGGLIHTKTRLYFTKCDNTRLTLPLSISLNALPHQSPLSNHKLILLLLSRRKLCTVRQTQLYAFPIQLPISLVQGWVWPIKISIYPYRKTIHPFFSSRACWRFIVSSRPNSYKFLNKAANWLLSVVELDRVAYIRSTKTQLA